VPPGTILAIFSQASPSHIYSVSLTYHLYPLLPIMPDDKSDHEGVVVVDDDELQLVNACSVDNQGGILYANLR